MEEGKWRDGENSDDGWFAVEGVERRDDAEKRKKEKDAYWVEEAE